MIKLSCMVDWMTKEKRSWIMSRIRSKNTKPEIIVRSMLHRMGYRFRLYREDLPGKPDIVLPKYKTVIFVHGCFWHNHKGCKISHIPKSNTSFWKTKFAKNVHRDKKNQSLLLAMGWNVIVIWECQLKNLKEIEKSIIALDRYLQSILDEKTK